MRVLLAALTGMGNEVLSALRACPLVKALAVVTRREAGPFPYFPCQPLELACREAEVECRVDADLDSQAGLDLVGAFAPDLLLTATYHRMVPQGVLDAAPLAVNIHPSLLPLYKGPTPTNWAVAYGEAESGVSFHLLAAEIDSGPLLMQYRFPIVGLTDGETRQRLYALAGRHAPDLLAAMEANACAPAPMAQGGSTQPRFASKQGLSFLRAGGFARENLIRAVTPYPGTQFLQSNGLL